MKAEYDILINFKPQNMSNFVEPISQNVFSKKNAYKHPTIAWSKIQDPVNHLHHTCFNLPCFNLPVT